MPTEHVTPAALRAGSRDVAHRAPDLGRDLHGARGIGVRQDQRELVAAVAEHLVGVAARRPKRPRNRGQQHVPRLVAAPVVEALEIVEVHDQQAERRSAVHRNLEVFLERALVLEAGERVGLGADLDRLVGQRVHEGDRDVTGEQLDELELLLA